jgi:hypothetical protein
VARPIDGNIPNRDNSNSKNASPRTFNGGSYNSPYGRVADDSPQSDRSSDNKSRGGAKSNQNRDGNSGSNDSNNVKRTGSGQNNPSGNVQLPGNTFGSGKGDNRFGRPQSNGPTGQTNTLGPGSKLTKDKVDDFLQLRRDNANNMSSGSGDRTGGGKFNRGGKYTDDGPGSFKSGQLTGQKTLTDSNKDADQAWVKRFGKRDSTLGNNPQVPYDGKLRDGKNDRGSGVVNFKGNNSAGSFPGSDRKFDKDFVDRKYQDWRKNTSDNKRGRDVDNRDWSGKWKNGDRFVAADNVRDYWKKNGKGNGKDLPFSQNWWHDHDGHHDHHDGNHHDGNWNHWDHFSDHHYHPYHWWRWSTAPLLTSWVSFGWSDPYYWDYGPGEYINCNNGIVYVNGTWFEPAPVFYRRTLLLAQQAPVWTPVQAAQVEWLPLGVFVVSRDGVPDNNVLVQLAVTKDGVIGGTIFNQLTGESFPIQGMVDKQTQRAAWTYNDDQGAQIVMESSVFNLTQPAATGLIHYGPDNIQVMELVRLEDPNANNQG